MSTSGSTDFSVTTEDIITEALELLGVLGEGEAPTADQITSSQRTLNMMAKTWQADGLNLFAVQRATLNLIDGQEVYNLGNTSSSSKLVLESLSGFLLADTLSGASSLVIAQDPDQPILDTEAGAYTNWFATVTFADGTTQDTPITTSGEYAPGILIVVIGDGTTDDLLEDSVVVLSRVSARPMSIIETYYRASSTDNFIPCKISSRKEYNELSRRDTSGSVSQVYYDPQIGDGNLYVWPTGNGGTAQELQVIIQRTLDDFDTSSDTPDWPQEWFTPLAFNLARMLAPKYGTPQMDYARIMQQARELYETARGFDTELYTSVYLGPDSTWRG